MTDERPVMLAFVRDAANLCTLLGLTFGVLGVAAAMAGRFEVASAFGLWAVVCDFLDGPIARRSTTRTEYHRAYGVQLDSLADIVCSSAFPAVLVVALHGGGALATVVAVLLVLAGAVRLAHFNVFGYTGGLAVTYTPVVTAIPVAVSPAVAAAVVPVALAVVIAAQLAPVPVPDPKGRALVVFLLCCLALSVVLLLR